MTTAGHPAPIGHLGVLSVETWDGVWRRNQHFAVNLVRSGAARRITFVGPPEPGMAVRARRWSPEPGVEAVTPPLLLPRSAPGGFGLLGAWYRRALRHADALWINDAGAGLAALRPGVPAVYDVTDDWRVMAQPERDRRRLVAAEDELATRARTVVCSDVLARRWRERYGVTATVVRNGVDLTATRGATRRTLDGDGPHAVYVGTLHDNRIDVELLERLAVAWPGTLHLVGPNGLPPATTAALTRVGARVVGPVPSGAVPGWLVSADVLVCPHLVDEFTLSLDAIKAQEYLATDRPVVATPSCGFQTESAAGLTVTAADSFVGAAVAAAGTGPFERDVAVDWSQRARQFAQVLAP